MSDQAFKILSMIVRQAGDLRLFAAVLAPGQMSPGAAEYKDIIRNRVYVQLRETENNKI